MHRQHKRRQGSTGVLGPADGGLCSCVVLQERDHMSTIRFNCSVGGAPPRVLEPVNGGLRGDEVRRAGVLREHTPDGLPQLLRPADIGSMAEAQRT